MGAPPHGSHPGTDGSPGHSSAAVGVFAFARAARAPSAGAAPDLAARPRAAAAAPVLRKELFSHPVTLAKVDLLRNGRFFLVRASSTDGAIGLAGGHGAVLESARPILVKKIAPYFAGKDARDLEALIDGVYVHASNYKWQGLPFWASVASVELAILDLLEQVSGRPLGDLFGGVTLYADANGSFDVPKAIEIGHAMHGHGLSFYGEPVPFDYYEETRQVADALTIRIAGGEEEPSLRQFRGMIETGVLQVVQPDMFYFGGMTRAMRVARMFEAAGFECTPHMSGSGLGFLYAAHFASAAGPVCWRGDVSARGSRLNAPAPGRPPSISEAGRTLQPPRSD